VPTELKDPQKYGVTAEAYLFRCLDLLEQPTVDRLFYAAFELRCAIERQVFDLYALLLHASGADPMKVMEKDKMYKPRAFVAEMRRFDPLFEKRLQFARIAARREGLVSGNLNFNSDWLCSTHEELNELLHHQKNPGVTVWKPGWVGDSIQWLKEKANQVREMMESNRGISVRLNSAGQAIWERLSKEDLSDEQLWRMMELSDSRLYRKIPLLGS